MRLRKLRSADLDELVLIDAQASAFPWSRGKFIESFTADAPCYVLEREGQVIGFAIYSQVLDEASLLNIAVTPAQQGKGYGAAILSRSLALLGAAARCCFLEVRESNQRAIALYRRQGFEQVGERRNYYPAETGREHARVMCLHFSNDQEA